MPFIGIAAKFIGLHLWTNFIRKDGVGYIWALVEGAGIRGTGLFIFGLYAGDKEFRHAFSALIEVMIRLIT